MTKLLFRTLLFCDGQPAQYEVKQKGDRFFFDNSYDLLQNPGCPSFFVWEDKGIWRSEAVERPENLSEDLVQQAVEEIENHFRPFRGR